ncbi:MAG: hypothetical protein KatS3mg038_2535 [Candidatus Kapaibacterium sp.]|nr:MAG: hypothetical protein KatS3mg038_2535 [Candidatus Kapabacteria bacterium]
MSMTAVAELDYVDDYGDVIEPTDASHLLYPHQQRIATIAHVAAALHCTYDYLLDLRWTDWIDHLLAAKAITWRRPTRNPSERYY